MQLQCDICFVVTIISFQLGHVFKLFCGATFSDLKDFGGGGTTTSRHRKVKLRFYPDVLKTKELHTELKFYTSEDIALYFVVLDNY